VTFNDHDGSTKSYRFTRGHVHDLAPVDVIPVRRELTGGGGAASATSVTMHDGSVVRFRPVDDRHDPTDRDAVYAHVRALQARGQVATGLLYLDEHAPSMHGALRTVPEPLVDLPHAALCPGEAALDSFMDELR
jgi:2-oxoglutarate ferredoxin oxidoreductase subunit beta